MDFKQFTGAPLNYALWYLYRLLTGQDPSYPGGIPSGQNTSTTEATYGQTIKTIAATGTPEAISATALLVDSVEIYARRSQSTGNTGTIYVGPSSADATNARPLANGESFTITAPPGTKINLADIYVDVATAGDGVVASHVRTP